MTSKKSKRLSKPGGELTLKALCEAYAKGMEREGKSPGTCASYMAELHVAMAELGVETSVAGLSPERVAEYFGCARVNKLRSGRPKSPLSIAKTQRVLRLALAFAEQQGWIEKAPLPVAQAANSAA